MIADESLARIVLGIERELNDAQMVRRRGGLSRATAWAECSGRLHDGAWGELRIHHRPLEKRLMAGMLAYQQLALGGRTIVVGEISQTYETSPIEIENDVAEEVRAWLARIAERGTRG